MRASTHCCLTAFRKVKKGAVGIGISNGLLALFSARCEMAIFTLSAVALVCGPSYGA
jgi:hypothetical protein